MDRFSPSNDEGIDSKIISQIMEEYIQCEQAVLDSGAYSLEQEQRAREKIRQASTLHLSLSRRHISDFPS